MLFSGQSQTSKSVVYVSVDNAQHWKPVLTGKYIYGFGNNGALVVAVESNKKTGSLLYSLNYGSTWHKFDLNKKVKVDYLFVQDNSQHPSVFLFGTNEKSTRTILLRVNFNQNHNEVDEVTMKNLEDEYDYDETFNTTTGVSSSSTYSSTSIQNEILNEIVNKQTQVTDKLPIKPEVSADCEKKCLAIGSTEEFICITEQIKCDGKIDCHYQTDELDCKHEINFDTLKKSIEQESVYIIIYFILGVILITSIVFTVLLVKLKFRISKNAIYTSVNAKNLKKKSQIYVSSEFDKLDLEQGCVFSDDKELLFKKDSEQF